MHGAWDYLIKPCSNRQIEITVTRAMRYRETKNGNGSFGKSCKFKRFGIIGDSLKLETTLDAAAKAASGKISVLISGETGTGKELLSRAIHGNSPRKDGPFLVHGLHEHPGHPGRKHHVRPRQGSLHRGHRGAGGSLQARGRRDALSRRGRRTQALAPEIPAARAPGPPLPPGGLGQGIHQRLLPDFGHQPRPQGHGREGQVPPGSLLQAHGNQHQHPSAAQPSVGHQRAPGPLHPARLRRAQGAGAKPFPIATARP